MKYALAFWTLLFIAHSALPAHAVIIQTNSYTSGSNQLLYPALNNDLINIGSPYLASETHTGYSPYLSATTTAALNDGSIGTHNGLTTIAADLVDGAWTSTYFLNTSISGAYGYRIREIRAITGWVDARTSMRFQLLVRPIGTPTFVSLGTYTLISGSGSSKITLTDSSGGYIATGVDAIRFSILFPGAGGNHTTYREIDVLGDVVPEPSALALFGGVLILGGVALQRRRCRGLTTARRSPAAKSGA